MLQHLYYDGHDLSVLMMFLSSRGMAYTEDGTSQKAATGKKWNSGLPSLIYNLSMLIDFDIGFIDLRSFLDGKVLVLAKASYQVI